MRSKEIGKQEQGSPTTNLQRRLSMITFNYVRNAQGDYAVQVVDDYGYFSILTSDLEYPQGIGWATEWIVVAPEEIPQEIRKELDLAIDGYLEYLAYRDSEDNPVG
jgi:hypothetical protein